MNRLIFTRVIGKLFTLFPIKKILHNLLIYKELQEKQREMFIVSRIFLRGLIH